MPVGLSDGFDGAVLAKLRDELIPVKPPRGLFLLRSVQSAAHCGAGNAKVIGNRGESLAISEHLADYIRSHIHERKSNLHSGR